MKVKVDEMPETPHECLFCMRSINYWGHPIYNCMLRNGAYPCHLTYGKEECPYLICDNDSKE